MVILMVTVMVEVMTMMTFGSWKELMETPWCSGVPNMVSSWVAGVAGGGVVAGAWLPTPTAPDEPRGGVRGGVVVGAAQNARRQRADPIENGL